MVAASPCEGMSPTSVVGSPALLSISHVCFPFLSIVGGGVGKDGPHGAARLRANGLLRGVANGAAVLSTWNTFGTIEGFAPGVSNREDPSEWTTREEGPRREDPCFEEPRRRLGERGRRFVGGGLGVRHDFSCASSTSPAVRSITDAFLGVVFSLCLSFFFAGFVAPSSERSALRL